MTEKTEPAAPRAAARPRRGAVAVVPPTTASREETPPPAEQPPAVEATPIAAPAQAAQPPSPPAEGASGFVLPSLSLTPAPAMSGESIADWERRISPVAGRFYTRIYEAEADQRVLQDLRERAQAEGLPTDIVDGWLRTAQDRARLRLARQEKRNQ